MSGWIVRTHPLITKLVFWKLLENRDFLWECCSVIFVKDVYPFLEWLSFVAYCLWLIAFQDAYLPESLLRVYIRVRKYGLAMLAGPIVMIVAHAVAKQS